MIIIDRWINRRVTNRLCERAVEIHRALDATEPCDQNDPCTIALRHGYLGELASIRFAICLLNSLDPHVDASEGGPADELVGDWWESRHPQDWEPPH